MTKFAAATHNKNLTAAAGFVAALKFDSWLNLTAGVAGLKFDNARNLRAVDVMEKTKENLTLTL